MKYLKFPLIFLIVFTCLVNFSVLKAQETINDKLIRLYEITMPESDWDSFSSQIIEHFDYLKQDSLLNENYEKVIKKFKDIGYEELKESVFDIYLKYFTEDEIDALLEFYSSELGKSILEKRSLVLNDLMLAGIELNQKIITEIIADEITGSTQYDLEQKYNIELNEDCSNFEEGDFYYYIPDSSIIEMTRKGDHQYEYFNESEAKLEIIWLSNNRYLLVPLDDTLGAETKDTLFTNIYEVTERSCRFITKTREGVYIMDGELFIKK